MGKGWDKKIKLFRHRHGLSQAQMGEQMGVSQRTISRWERGDDTPSISRQKRLRDLGWEPSMILLENLRPSILHCPAPRALTMGQNLNLQVLSKPAIEKRPSMQQWIGRDLREIASGILVEILDDHVLQRAINKKEIACVVTTSKSVLRTVESAAIGTFETTISYFYHEGIRYQDAVSMPVSNKRSHGYIAIPMDEGSSPFEQSANSLSI